MATDYAEEYKARWMERDLEAYLSELCPDPACLRLAAGRVAESIKAAHALSPGRWGITKKAGFIRLNFGRMEAILWTPEAFELMADVPTLRMTGGQKQLGATIVRDYGPFKTAPDSRYVRLSTIDPGTLQKSLEAARGPHLQHLKTAATSSINGATRMAHHPGLVDALGRLAGVTLPQPEYVAISRPALVEPSALVQSTAPNSPANGYDEGHVRDVVESRYERDPRARRDCLAHYGTACSVCDVRLEDRYGDPARDLIHVHHLRPFRDTEGMRRTNPVADLRPVCPNCHAVLHRRSPPYSVEEARALIPPHERRLTRAAPDGRRGTLSGRG